MEHWTVKSYEITNLFLKQAISRVTRSWVSARVSPSICKTTYMRTREIPQSTV